MRIDDPRRAFAVERHDELLGGDAAILESASRVMTRGIAVSRSRCRTPRSGWSAEGGSLSHTFDAGACDLFRPQRLGERPLIVDEDPETC